MADDAEKVAFELVTPERLLVSRDVDMVVVPGEDGDFGVLPGHALVISGLRNGVVELYDDSAVTDRIFVAGGFAEATSRRCTVLAEEALSLADVRRSDVERRLGEADQALEDARDDDERAHANSRRAVEAALLEALDYHKLGL